MFGIKDSERIGVHRCREILTISPPVTFDFNVTMPKPDLPYRQEMAGFARLWIAAGLKDSDG